MGVVKQIDIKNGTYYFFNDMINIKYFDPMVLEINKIHTKIMIFTILDIIQLKKLMIVKIFTA